LKNGSFDGYQNWPAGLTIILEDSASKICGISGVHNMNKNKKNTKKILAAAFIILFAINSLAIANIDKVSYLVGSATTYTAPNNVSVYNIARKFQVATQHITMANKMSSEYLKSGKEIVIPTVWIAPINKFDNGLVLNLAETSIYVYKDSKVIAVYPVAIGMLGWNTPTGDFKITSKTKDPTWFPPAWANVGHPVGPGPGNPLGDRWMGLTGGYGIHATNAPSSIGYAASHGCIRMYPESARSLFEQTYVGMPVKIMYETVKLGFSAPDGKIYMSVFPDIYYYGTNNASTIKKKLADAGIDKFVDEKKLAQIIKNKKGIPEVLIGSDYTLKIGEQKINTAFSPIIKDNETLVSCDLFTMLGFEVSYDNITDSVNISYKNNKFTTKLNAHYGYFDGKKIDFKIPAQMLGNVIIVPLNVINAFGFTAEQKNNEIVLTDIKNPLRSTIATEETSVTEPIAADTQSTILFKKKQ